MNKILRPITTGICVLFCAGMYYLTLPAITFRSPGFWCYLMLVLFCVTLSITACLFDISRTKNRVIIGAWIGFGAYLVIFGICGIVSSAFFHASAAQKIANVTISEVGIEEAFADLSESSNIQNLPLVDLDTAKMLGDKPIADLANASWYDVDEEYNLIEYQGKYYRLSVVDYGGLFKYNKASKTGLPGYVLVDVTPKNGKVTQEATLVKLGQTIQYSPGAYWSHDLRRHLRGQYPTYMFDTSYLEIDDEGVPYWVTGVKRPTAGVFGFQTVENFILTNAQTGESVEYSIEEAPEWIDHIFSLDYLMEIAYWHYAYADGYWNNVFSKTGVWRTSYDFRDKHRNSGENEAEQFANFFGYSSIVSKDGQVMFYTGLTAANNAESNLGWLTIDTSTGKMVQYNVVGAEESSAQAAVEQLVQQYRYEATFPLPVNIGGNPSYIMCLKGKAGLVQGYGIVNMRNYSIAVQADTIDKAVSLYLRRLNGETGEADTVVEQTAEPTEPSYKELISGTGEIEAIYTAEIDGTTQFYYVVDGTLYRSSITINQEQILYKSGDVVTFEYYDDGEILRIVNISKN